MLINDRQCIVRHACLLSLAGAATSMLFVATNIILSRQKFYCNKKVCRDKSFVARSILLSRHKKRSLSRQTRVCHDKTFVATKSILVAALDMSQLTLCHIVSHNYVSACTKCINNAFSANSSPPLTPHPPPPPPHPVIYFQTKSILCD